MQAETPLDRSAFDVLCRRNAVGEVDYPAGDSVMDKLVRRVTVIHGTRDDPKSVAVYREPLKERNKVSVLTRPLERGARRLEKALVIFGQESLRRHEESNRRRRDGWLLDLPGNFVESSRKALNEARKAVPFVNLPKL
jgi:Family of unknown function (DUF6312)